MRIKASHLLAAGVALALAGWLASGQLGAGNGAREAPATARGDAAGPRLMSVRVRESTAQSIERQIVLNGYTAPVRVVEVRAETDGRVIALGAQKGDFVETGALLVRLDPRDRQAAVAEAEARVLQWELENEAATKLGQKGFQAETKVAETKAALEAARAVLERARLNLAHTELRAPFAGVLDQRPAEIGGFLDIGDPVGTVVDQDPFLIKAHVAEQDVGRLAVGMAGRARLVTGETVEGRIRYLASQADPQTRTFTLELEVPNPNRRFAAGVTAELRIAYEQAPAHRVPASLLALSDEGVLGVKTVNGDDEVVFHPAEIVRAEADAVWVTGLPEEVRLITIGHGFVRAGDQVRPVPEGASASPGPLVAETRR
jgi:multidrug efflux system membrane fusion protein